jgi:Holliday junction resolvase RusA-like endonuclease
MKFEVYNINPVPKPRQTRSAKWKKRACDQRYYRFKDEIRFLGVTVPESGFHVLFVLKMPLSWSKKKRNSMRHIPHCSRPDKDNLEKALLDAIYKEDSSVWDGRVSKVWGDEGRIIIISGIGSDWIKGFLDEHNEILTG